MNHIDQLIYENEKKRIAVVKDIAQANVDKVEIMRDRATYESNFATHYGFKNIMVQAQSSLNAVFDKLQSKEKKRISHQTEKLKSEFINHAKFSIMQLNNVMYGFSDDFRIYHPQHNVRYFLISTK